MNAPSRTLLAYASIPPRNRRSLLARLLRLDASYRQKRAVDRLDGHLRRDVGLEASDAPRWDAPEWWR